MVKMWVCFFFQAEDGIRYLTVTGVQTCALPIFIRTVADEGRTVLFSSHLLEEVEQVADHVTMISGGRIVLSEPLHVLKEAHRGASLDQIFVSQVGTAV